MMVVEMRRDVGVLLRDITKEELVKLVDRDLRRRVNGEECVRGNPDVSRLCE